MIAGILSLLGAVLYWVLVVFARAVGGVLGVGWVLFPVLRVCLLVICAW